MSLPDIAILHYSAPPVIGGVEVVIEAHSRLISDAGYPLDIITGRGEAEALPEDADLALVPEMDSQHPAVLEQNELLHNGQVPADFERLVNQLENQLAPFLKRVEITILHNVFTKHFNLPLTAALHRLLDDGVIKNCIAWCHDFSWTSENSLPNLHPGYPWDLLRTPRPDVRYVVVSENRQKELAGLFGYPMEKIQVIYNGVDPLSLLGLSLEGYQLAQRLGLFESDLVLLMPVRVTQAKNIEYALRLVKALKEWDVHPKLLVTGPPDPHDERSMVYFQSLLDLRRDLGVENETAFVFNSGPDPEEPFLIDASMVGEIFRLSDIMFMPSHREGFGMPVLEAGLSGIQVITTEVPAAVEIGGDDVLYFDRDQAPIQLARRIIDWAGQNQIYRLRKRVRQGYTWQAIFQTKIQPLFESLIGRPDALLG